MRSGSSTSSRSGILYPGKTCVIGNGVVVDPRCCCAEIDGLRARGVDVSGLKLSRQRAPDHALPPAARHGGRAAAGQAPDRHDQARHRALPTPTRPRAWASACRTCSTRRSSRRRSRPRWSPSASCCARSRRTRDRPAADDRGVPAPTATGSSSTSPTPRRWPGARSTTTSTSCSRAPRARCWTSTTAPIPSSRRPTRSRAPRASAPASARKRHRRGLGRHEGLRHARRRRAVPDRAARRGRRGDPPEGRRVRHDDRPRRGAPAGWTSSRCATPPAELADARLAVTKLDVLSGFDTIKVCTQLPRHATTRTSSPRRSPTTSRCCTTPRGEYDELPGWSEDITECRSETDLPADRARLPRPTSRSLGVPIVLIGVGPGREQIIWTEAPAALAARRPAPSPSAA